MGFILMVEDDQKELEDIISVGTYFSGIGHRVEIVTSGNEAMNVIATECPDILVTDIVLPEYDGIELIMRLRKSYPERNSGVILLLSMHSEVGSSLVNFCPYHNMIDRYVIKPLRGRIIDHGNSVTYHEQLVVSIGHLLHCMQ